MFVPVVAWTFQRFFFQLVKIELQVQVHTSGVQFWRYPLNSYFVKNDYIAFKKTFSSKHQLKDYQNIDFVNIFLEPATEGELQRCIRRITAIQGKGKFWKEVQGIQSGDTILKKYDVLFFGLCKDMFYIFENNNYLSKMFLICTPKAHQKMYIKTFFCMRPKK